MKNKDEMESFLMNLFFSYAWKKKPKVCECGCGTLLPKQFTITVLDHLLEKSIYPECKYAINGIMFVNPDCHASRHNGNLTKNQIMRIKQAKENYENLVKESTLFVDRVLKKLQN